MAEDVQFEVLTKLQELWRNRAEGCPDAPVLEYVQTVDRTDQDGSGTVEYRQFKVSSGLIEPPTEKERTMFDYILTPDCDGSDELPVEMYFDDLLFNGLVFPLNKTARQKWDSQSAVVRTNVAAANVSDLGVVQNQTTATLQIYCSSGLFKFIPGKQYRLSPRLVDFNTSKVLQTLVEADLDCLDADDPPAFMRLVTGTNIESSDNRHSELRLMQEQAIHRQFKELKNLGNEAAGALLLKPSQRKAARRIISSNLAVIWGPPGEAQVLDFEAKSCLLLSYRYRQDIHNCTIFPANDRSGAENKSECQKDCIPHSNDSCGNRSCHEESHVFDRPLPKHTQPFA